MSVSGAKSQDLVLGPAGSEVAHAGKASLAGIFSCQIVSSTQFTAEGETCTSCFKSRGSVHGE